jgi:hypothetical protein
VKIICERDGRVFMESAVYLLLPLVVIVYLLISASRVCFVLFFLSCFRIVPDYLVSAPFSFLSLSFFLVNGRA